MKRRLGLRARLTLAVTAVFAVALDRARRVGFEVPEGLVKDAAAIIAEQKVPDGSFVYSSSHIGRGSSALMNLGAMLHLLSRGPEALYYLEKALTIEECAHGVHANMATVLASMGQLDEAIQHSRRTVELAPDDFTGQGANWEALSIETIQTWI